MKLIEKIVDKDNLKMAIKKVKSNKGAPGVDKMTILELEEYFNEYQDDIINQILEKKYKPNLIRRVYIPKPNGSKRPLGIPTVVDGVIQQAIAQVLVPIYEPIFSEHSFGFRPNRSAHDALRGLVWLAILNLNHLYIFLKLRPSFYHGGEIFSAYHSTGKRSKAH